MTWARAQRTGSPGSKAVLMVLADYADERGTCWPAQETIAWETEMSTSTVYRRLRDLEALGLVTTERSKRPDGTWWPNRYRLALAHPPVNLTAGPPVTSDATTGQNPPHHRSPVTAEPPQEPPQEPPLVAEDLHQRDRATPVPVDKHETPASRAAAAPPAPAPTDDLRPRPGDPPHCGSCHPRTRLTDDAARCPACHPDPAARPVTRLQVVRADPDVNADARAQALAAVAAAGRTAARRRRQAAAAPVLPPRQPERISDDAGAS